MASGDRIYHGSIRVISFVFIVLGLVILATTLGAGGGPLSVGTLLGVVFVAIGAGRLWISTRTGSR
jgi:hypothetical protein